MTPSPPLSGRLDKILFNYWGYHVTGTASTLTISDGNAAISLMTDKPGSILACFQDDKEAATFLAGVWIGHKAEPVTVAGVTTIMVVV